MKRLRIDDELADAIDGVRGDVPRDRWVSRVLWDRLEQPTHAATAEVRITRSQSAPQKTYVKPASARPILKKS